ncbi:uncharacterized protein G2W53_017747 [Senna tora]|uniref:Uncharacterized protein n=1 Tax=Senna tora TaxID=362788 RepID=A0A834TQJ2_9FABA|nr:uncharacterized protein G2W53_017747 [Senna tora]
MAIVARKKVSKEGGRRDKAKN